MGIPVFGRPRMKLPASALLHTVPVVPLPDDVLHGPQVLQEPLDKGTVRCELAHEVDQVCLEVLELRKRTAELEKHLGTAPEAGGGPPSQQQPRAPDTVALGREVGGLCWPPISSGLWPSRVSLQKVPCGCCLMAGLQSPQPLRGLVLFLSGLCSRWTCC